MEVFIVLLLGLLIAYVTYNKKLLSLGGSISVLVMLLIIDIFGKWQMVSLIIWAYVTLSIIDKIFDERIEKSVDGIHEKSGVRVASQVWVNGGAAVASIILFGITGRPSFMIGYIVAIGEAYADSLASDVGVMSSKPPVDICTFKPITNGLSGGISVLGSAASFLGVLIYSVLSIILWQKSLFAFGIIIFSSMIGCIFDSIIGSKLQIKYICNRCKTITEKKTHCGERTIHYKGLQWLNNSMVNLISNVFSSIVGIIMFEIINTVIGG